MAPKGGKKDGERPGEKSAGVPEERYGDAERAAAEALLRLAEIEVPVTGSTEITDDGDRPTRHVDDATIQLLREEAEEIALESGDYIDINQVPEGRGRYYWLNPTIDQPRADALGIANPLEMTIMREQNRLPAGVRQDQLPRVRYTPDRRFFNINTTPDVAGRWEFFTTQGDSNAREEARLQFGGQEDFGFANNNNPSAQDVFNLRQLYQRRIEAGEADEDPTAEIEIVWVPYDGWDTPPVSRESTPSSDSSVSNEDPDVVDTVSGITHDPLNRGENNQTGTYGARHYQTREINGRNYTVDRARARLNNPEPHKSWAVNNNGQWRQYSHYGTMDWTDHSSVEKLNKWREQQFSRSKWPNKRTEKRDEYTEEQKTWLFEYIKASKGDRPLVPIPKITASFNRKFQTSRPDSGISGILERLKTQYKKNGGKLVLTQGRRHSSKAPKDKNKKQPKRKRKDDHDDEPDDEEEDPDYEEGEEDEQ